MSNIQRQEGVSANSFALTGLSNEDYHADKEILSTSGMKMLLQSPAHFKYAQRTESPDMLKGTALHMLLLEPAKFFLTYAVFNGDKRGKKYTDFIEDNPGKIIISTSLMDELSGMRDSVFSYPMFDLESLFSMGQTEHSVFWEDAETGVKLKARADCLIDNMIFDVKKTIDCRPKKFVNRCIDLRYDVQAANYKEGYRNFLGKDVIFMFIAIEDAAPHGVWIHESSAAMEARGEKDARYAIDLYARCKEKNEWPLYQEPKSLIEWPDWMCV